MPRRRLRFAGIAAALLVTGCTAMQEAQAPLETPTAEPTVASGAALNWAQNLTFSGELTGQVTTIVASGPGQRSECSGRTSASAGRWDSAIYGQLPATGVIGLIVTVSPYRGPGRYTSGVSVQVHTADNQRVWAVAQSDAVSYTVAPDEASGSIDASLTNQVNTTGRLRVAGTWSCGR